MSIHFAAATRFGHGYVYPPISGSLVDHVTAKVANDNRAGGIGQSEGLDAKIANDKLLKAALRHFAQHGIGAAREARAQAEKAFFEGDRQSYRWWLDVTRTLDRRLASEAERISSGSAGA